MLVLGHLAGGYLVIYFLLKLIEPNLNQKDINFLLILGTIFGAIVDFDLISYFIKNKTFKLKKDVTHRDQMSHAPLLWLIIGLLVYFLSSDLFTSTLGLVLLFSVFGHFLFDSFEYGIMWLYPFSRKRYHLFENVKHNLDEEEPFFKHYWKFFFNVYPKAKTFWIEIIVIVIALFVYFKMT